jgi:hypothetical protein
MTNPLKLLLLSLATAFAQTIAVLEITIPDTPEEENAEVELVVKEIRFLTDELRRQATVTLPKEWSVLTREQILAFAMEMEKDTAETDSLVQEHDLETALGIGKALKSSFVAEGHISKLGSLLTLKVSLYDTESEQLLADFTGESQDLKGLMDVIRGNAPKLFKKLLPEEEKEEFKPEPVKVTVEVQTIPTNITAEPKTKLPIWVPITFDALSIAAFSFGIYKHFKANDHYDKYSNLSPGDYYGNESEYRAAHRKAKDAQTVRNVSFGVGGVLLLTGAVIHVWF